LFIVDSPESSSIVEQMVNTVFLFLLAATSKFNDSIVSPDEPADGASSPQLSRWSRRTAKRRQKTEHLIHSVEQQFGDEYLPSSVALANTIPIRQDSDDVPTLLASKIDWTGISPALDPIHGGNLRPGTTRGARKRSQVEAFATVLSSLLSAATSNRSAASSEGTTIIDAGSGAGNLAIALAGLLTINLNSEGRGQGEENNSVNVLAVDINNRALERLTERADAMPMLRPGSVQVLCADIAKAGDVLAHVPTTNQNVIVVSLHACGSASDMAMNLAFECGAPFVICPCCTAKSLTKRADEKKSNTNNDGLDDATAEYDPSASFQRSGATPDIKYPRSDWLKNAFMRMDIDTKYSVLAKVADVGLGPQTPSEQRDHQRRAKKIIELDRLLAASEQHGYDVRLLRIQDHDPLVYGKGDLLLGAKRGSVEAKAIRNLPVQ
jgi:hypothetical protein